MSNYVHYNFNSRNLFPSHKYKIAIPSIIIKSNKMNGLKDFQYNGKYQKSRHFQSLLVIYYKIIVYYIFLFVEEDRKLFLLVISRY